MALSPDYWNCGCPRDFIHPNTDEFCPICGSRREDSPPSHLCDIDIAMNFHPGVGALKATLRERRPEMAIIHDGRELGTVGPAEGYSDKYHAHFKIPGSGNDAWLYGNGRTPERAIENAFPHTRAKLKALLKEIDEFEKTFFEDKKGTS